MWKVARVRVIYCVNNRTRKLEVVPNAVVKRKPHVSQMLRNHYRAVQCIRMIRCTSTNVDRAERPSNAGL